MKSKTENADLSGSEFINTNLGEARFRDVRLAVAQFIDFHQVLDLDDDRG